MEEAVFLDMFTLADKYQMIRISLLLIILNIAVFQKLTSITEENKYQIKTRKECVFYLLIVAFVIIASFSLISMPYLNEKTLKTEEKLYEGYFGEGGAYFTVVEEAYYPEYENGNLSWYTVPVKDKKHLEIVKAKSVVYKRNGDIVNIYESADQGIYRTDDERNFGIAEATGPKEHRGNETVSYWYSLALIFYNIVIAGALYPLLSMYREHVHFIWSTQNMISSLFLAILLSDVLLF